MASKIFQALSLWQPWSSLVAIGAKSIETRGRYTSIRGPLAIHATKKWDAETWEPCLRDPTFATALGKYGYHVKQPAMRRGNNNPIAEHNLPLGAVLCIVNLIDCVKMGPPRTSTYPVWLNAQSPKDYMDLLTPNELAFGSYAPGRYALILEMIERFETPIPAIGQRMFGWKWTRPDDSAIAVPEPPVDESFRLT